MKIGQFAKENNTSIDTIRHYMSLGLLLPKKAGNQYEFDEKCTSDYIEIQRLKQIGFTLSEIQHLMLYTKMGKMTGSRQRISYLSYFENKRRQVVEELERLESMKLQLASYIEEMKGMTESDEEIHSLPGVRMSTLDMLCCNKCKGNYNIESGNIIKGELYEAVLRCGCGSELFIEDGIIFGEGSIYDSERACREEMSGSYSELYIDEYINTTDINYLHKLQSGLEWSLRHIPFEKASDATVLELGSGHGYFMRHVLDSFPDSSTYIAVDHDRVKMKWLRRVIEKNNPKCNVVFICTDFENIPLRDNTVDLLLDIAGSSNYAFENREFLLRRVDHLMKKGGYLHGSYILFKNFKSNSKIPRELRVNFMLDHVKKEIENLNYSCTDEHVSSTVVKGGPMEDYFVEGEEVYTYQYTGVKIEKL